MAHMEVLLCDDVDNLGHRGQVVKVRAGYGRNYLLPQGLALEATAGNKRMIDEQRRILAKREKREKETAQGQADSLNGFEIHFNRRVGEHGVLYGSVTALDIVDALKEKGFQVERRRVALREPIKSIGEYQISIKLHREVSPLVKVVVHKEGEAEVAPPELAVPPDPDVPEEPVSE
jgi:large subunit ribosomal protein L9